MAALPLLPFGLGLGACGGRTVNPGDVDAEAPTEVPDASNVATLPGEPLPSDTGGGFYATFSETGTGSSLLGVMLTNFPNLCASLRASINPPYLTVLLILVDDSEMADPAPPGTYPVVAGTQTGTIQVSATYEAQGAACAPIVNETATSGTVTFTVAGPKTVAGSYDLRFPGGDHFTGSFSVPVCGGTIIVSSPEDAGPQLCTAP
jgi:hypothetical protein